MKAICRIEFEDGSVSEIDLGSKCVEIGVSEDRDQSIGILIKPHKDIATLSFTKPLMKGKRFNRIIIEKISS